MKNIFKIALPLAKKRSVSDRTLRSIVVKAEGLKQARTPAQKTKVNREVERLKREINEIKINTTINPNYYEDLAEAQKAIEARQRKERRERKRQNEPRKEKEAKPKKEKPFLGSTKESREIAEDIGKFAKELPEFEENGETMFFGGIPYFMYNSYYETLLDEMQNISSIILRANGIEENFDRNLNALFERLRDIYNITMNNRNNRKSNTNALVSYPIYDFTLKNGTLTIDVYYE